jgi:hypothetical protein
MANTCWPLSKIKKTNLIDSQASAHCSMLAELVDERRVNLNWSNLMSKNIIAIKKYLLSVGAPEENLLTSDEEESNFLTSVWINYTLGEEDAPKGNFLLRLRYDKASQVFQTQFWGRDFYEEWIGTNKHAFVSLLANRINNKLNLGSLWLNLDDGTVALVSSMIVADGGVSPESIKANINGLIDVLHQYYPALKMYVTSEGLPEDFESALVAIS